MTQKIALIAGGSSGVGKRTAIDLAKRHIRVIIVARNANKCQQAVAEIKKTSGNSAISYLNADLSTKQNIIDLGVHLTQELDHLDILVSSFGILRPEQHLTADGYDQNFVLNYLGHFCLINALLPLLKKSIQGRILLIGALPLLVKRLQPSLPQPVPNPTKYNGMNVVSKALLGRILLTQSLAHQLQDTNVTINIFHPGSVPDSNYGSENISRLLQLVGPIMARLSKQNQPIGAQLATDPVLSETSGQFFNESQKIIPLPAKLSLELADQWYRASLKL